MNFGIRQEGSTIWVSSNVYPINTTAGYASYWTGNITTGLSGGWFEKQSKKMFGVFRFNTCNKCLFRFVQIKIIIRKFIIILLSLILF